jgi:hypothetical protein
MRGVKPLAFLAVVVALAGCGGPTDRCQAMSPCPKDSPKTSGDIKACQDATKNPPKCYAQKAAFDDCFLTQAVCGSDGKTDPLQTFMACRAESDAFQACNQ